MTPPVLILPAFSSGLYCNFFAPYRKVPIRVLFVFFRIAITNKYTANSDWIMSRDLDILSVDDLIILGGLQKV